jgi:hypothetical protein
LLYALSPLLFGTITVRRYILENRSRRKSLPRIGSALRPRR